MEPSRYGAGMLEPDTLASALDEVRVLVRADGGDLVLTQIEGSRVDLRLIVEGAECAECVMPREFLEQVALDILRRKVPAVGAVTIADPREEA